MELGRQEGKAKKIMNDMKKKFKAIISRIDPNGDAEWDPARQDEIKLLSRNASDTISFIKTDMDADDLCWFAEIFDEVFAEIYSDELRTALEDAFRKFEGEEDIEWASDAFDIALALAEQYGFPKPGFRIP